MRSLTAFALLALIAFAQPAPGAPPKDLGDITLEDGRALKAARIISVAPLKVTLRHAEGIVSVEKAKLPEAIRAHYPDDLNAAEKESAQAAEKRAMAEQKRADEQNRLERERQRRADSAANYSAQVARQESAEQAAHAEARAIAQSEAATYFRTKWRPGNNSVFITKLQVTIQEVEPVPGWAGRWNAKGTAFVEYYMSSGSSFTSVNQAFEAQVERKGYNTRCDITLR